jgi:hypothetical protein
MYLTGEEREIAREHADDESRKRGWCWNCECNVTAVSADCGIGRYEYWGCKGVHRDWRDVCPTCGEEVTEEKPETEE